MTEKGVSEKLVNANYKIFNVLVLFGSQVDA